MTTCWLLCYNKNKRLIALFDEDSAYSPASMVSPGGAGSCTAWLVTMAGDQVTMANIMDPGIYHGCQHGYQHD